MSGLRRRLSAWVTAFLIAGVGATPVPSAW